MGNVILSADLAVIFSKNYDYSFHSRVVLFVIIIIVFLISCEIDNCQNDDYEYQRNGVPKAVRGRS